MDVPHRQVDVADAVIGRAGDAFVAALEVGNAKAASASYTVEARLLAPSAEVFRGRDAIERFWRAGVDAGISGVRLETIELVRLSCLAYEIGQYTLGLRPADGIPMVESGKYVRIHEQQADGSWLWAVEMFNPEAASAHGRATTTQGGIR